MKIMLPFTPHLALECLEKLGCDDTTNWPKINKNLSSEIKVAVQVNGKTRDIIEIKKDLNEEEVNKIIYKNSKAKKYIENKKIKKTIFVKNKIINYIIQMKYKKYLKIILLIFFLNSCGFKPYKSRKNFKIENFELIGDKKINYIIKNKINNRF